MVGSGDGQRRRSGWREGELRRGAPSHHYLPYLNKSEHCVILSEASDYQRAVFGALNQFRCESNGPAFFAVPGERLVAGVAPFFAEVDPGGVHFPDQGEFFGAGPAFELLFSSDGACG